MAETKTEGSLIGGAAAIVEDDEAEQERIDQEAREIACDLLINKGLYASADATGDLGAEVLHKLRYSEAFGFDAYCIGCRRETTFRIYARDVPSRGIGGKFADQTSVPTLFAVNATCQRDFTVYSYVILQRQGKLIKVGQYPSVADIAFGELRAIDKALDEIDRQELGKALGLFSHDSALGAFAYLRRVFERMIDRAYQRQTQAGHPVENFADMRMDAKVAALKDELPDAAVRNSGVFSILSMGLHELTEEQCTKHFPVIKAVLFQMLEQEEHKRKAAITQRETEAALQSILSNPKGREKGLR